MKRIPNHGIVGVAACAAVLREAATNEFRAISSLVMQAIRATLTTDRYCEAEAIFPDRVVVACEGRKYAYPYTIGDDNKVVLGARYEVIDNYLPVAMREASDGHFYDFAEAKDGDGKTGAVWEAVLIRSGQNTSGNRYYPDTVLRESAPLFDGARIFVKADAVHLAGGGKDPRNIVGFVSEPRFLAGKSADTGALVGKVTFLEAASSLPATLREAWGRGKKDLMGLSIDAAGTATRETRDGKAVAVAKSITKVHSVDLIVEPGAGGGLVRMLEAAATTQESFDMTLKQRMLEALKAKKPDAFAKINPDTITEEALEQAYREAFEAAPAAAPPVAAPPALVPAAQGLVTMEHLRMLEARQNARDIIGTSRLPDAAKARLAADFAAKERFTEADVTAAIKAEATYLAQFSEAGKVVIGSDGEVQVEDRAVRMAGMFDAFFDPTHKDHRNVRSFRECYVEVTGDKHVTGRLEDCDRVRMAESLGVFRESLTTASWANVLGNSITRRMIADYRGTSEYDVWRPLVGTPVPIQDFRSNERTRYGGYGDLPAVAQGGAYAALTSPGDEKSTYAIAKKGGTEDLTLEMVANDDVGAIRQLPIRLSRAAKRTLGKFVLDFYATNPAIYDGVAWFHASHGNLATAALDATSLAARRLAMLKQAELGSADRLGIGPKYLIVPPDLVETATNLFNRTTNHDETFVQKMRLEIIPVWYWTDVNDWALQADPMNAPSFELGFYQGNEEPELFVQDMPNVGSLFSNDKVTWKIRHIYGGAVVDYRTADKSVVA